MCDILNPQKLLRLFRQRRTRILVKGHYYVSYHDNVGRHDGGDCSRRRVA